MRLSKESARRRALKQQRQLSASDERETKGEKRSGGHIPVRHRRDRISPESPRMLRTDSDRGEAADTAKNKRRKSKTKRGLKVDTRADDEEDWVSTPRTASSTPSPGVRTNGDLRSPGQRKTPASKVASNGAVPDFITQTDKYGNASTPRSPDAIQKARVLHPSGAKPHLHVGKDGKLTEEDDDKVDACTETLLDSIRLMCCCLVPEEPSTGDMIKSQGTEEEVIVEDHDRPRLLPKIHPDDHGKKCLVLDLDETLVHSSFRAVPGADFVIPVQVCDNSRIGLFIHLFSFFIIILTAACSVYVRLNRLKMLCTLFMSQSAPVSTNF